MPEVQISQYVNAPPGRVWEFLSDLRRAPEWVTVMEALLDVSEEPIRQGSVYRERSKIGPGVSETEWKITTFDPPKVQVHQCSERTFRATLIMAVEPEGSGTRLHHQTHFEMMPVFRPLGWLLEKVFGERTMARELRQSVENARRILEAEAAPSARGQ